MNRRQTRSFCFACGLLLGLVLLSSGCQAKDEADQRVDRFVRALQSGDWADMQSLSGATLKADVDEQRFRTMSRVVQKLGPYQDRTMSSINVSNNRTNASYTLEFEGGTVSLDVRFIDGLLEGFNLTGQPVVDAMDEVEAEGPL